MIEILDYFMRRKGLLLAILAVFMASSILSYQVFRSNAAEKSIEYISIKSWGRPLDVEIPHTGEMQPTLSVMSPRDLVNLLFPSEETAPVDVNNELDDNIQVGRIEPIDETPLENQIAENPVAIEPDEPSSDAVETEISDSQNDLVDSAGQNNESDMALPGESENLPEDERDVLSADELTNLENNNLESSTNKDETRPAPKENQVYLIFLGICGIIVAAALVYFSEQHFLR